MDFRFHVGQRVKFVKHVYDDDEDTVRIGETGTVRGIVEAYPHIGVEWDDYNADRHNLSYLPDYRCELGHGWFVHEKSLATIDDQPINIEELI